MCSGLASNASEFFPAGQSGDTSVTGADRLACMNGTIGFDTQVGCGTTFWVDFPLALVA
jgi:hypothetical protein